jgi:hypothetical protein
MNTVDEAIAIVEALLKPHFLSAVQELVLRRSWLGLGYEEMSESSNYDADYLRNVGAKLWQTLSDAAGERVTKSNFRTVLRQSLPEQAQKAVASLGAQPLPEFPDSPVSVTSALYIQRPPLEQEATEAILLPGALLCVKAPQRMGKTSLLLRTLHYARSQGYRVARINVRQAESAILENLGPFLQWLCTNLALQLNLEPRLKDYWEPELGSKVSCTMYLQNYILTASEQPLLLALDEVSHLFEYPAIAREFLPMLRFWHEEGKNLPVWEKLHLMIAHSTDCYIPLNISQSPFNVGLSLQLEEFTPSQVLDLAQRYGLPWQQAEVAQLMQLIGGHPYLIRLAFYYLVRGHLNLAQLLQQAPTQAGIYSDHLQAYLVALHQRPELRAAFGQVISAKTPIQIETIAAYKLYRMGLVKLINDSVTPSCQLIRQYFRDRLTS